MLVTIGGKHPGFRESVSLRGRTTERRPRPEREAKRGPSPPGKLGAMDHARRDGRSPGVRGNGLATEGCSAAFEGGELAKSPKGCEPFTSGQSVRGCILAGVVERRHQRPERIRFGPCFHGALPTAHLPDLRETWVPRTGAREWQTLGEHWPRKGHVVLQRARRRSRGCALTLYVSLQKSTGGFGSKKPFLQTQASERGLEDAVNGSHGLRITIVQSRVRYSRRRALSYETSRCEATRGGRSRRRHEADNRSARCATPREPASVLSKGVLGTRENQGKTLALSRQRMRNHRPKGRKKSSASLVERRRLGPEKVSSLHGGGPESVLASLTESATRAPRKGALRKTGIERGSRQGCQRLGRTLEWSTGSPKTRGAVVKGRKRPHDQHAVRRSD